MVDARDVNLLDKILLKKRGILSEELKSHKEDELDWEQLDRAVEALHKKIKETDGKLKVGVHYDVDVDGLYAGYIMEDTLKRSHINVVHYMNKLKVHGITDDSMQWVREEGLDVYIVVDAGSGNIDKANLLAKEGVLVIILDHHDYTSDLLPIEGVYRVNPIDFIHLPKLSGCGVVYRYVEKLSKPLGLKVAVYEKFVGITVLSDVCSMVDSENRYYVERAYEEYQSTLFFQKFKFYGSYKSFYSFGVIPYLNALIRTGNNKKALTIVNNMNYKTKMNSIQRDVARVKGIQAEMIEELKSVSRTIVLDKVVISLRTKGREILSNVNGLYANQLINSHWKSTMVLKYYAEDKVWKGSFRGWIFSKEELEPYGFKTEGHPNACGLEVSHSDLKEFMKTFKTKSEYKERYDAIASIDKLTDDFLVSVANFNEIASGEALQPVQIKLKETVADIDEIDNLGAKRKLYYIGGKEIIDFKDRQEGEIDIVIEPSLAEGYNKGYKLLRV